MCAAKADDRPAVRSFRVVLLGDLAVGKSSLALRFVQDQFLDKHEATVGATYFTHAMNVTGKSLRLEIWDTAGQERYDSITPIYYRGADCALCVYDVTSPSSLERAKKWVKRLQAEVDNIVVTLIANKVDLTSQRKISEADGRAFAEEYDCLYYEASAKTNVGVTPLFIGTAEKLLEKPPKEVAVKPAVLSPSPFQSSGKRGCCS